MKDTFARRLVNARKIRCMSQRDLVDRMEGKVSSTAIEKYEKAPCFRHALPKSRLTQSSTSRYSSACSSSMPSITLVGRVWPGLV